MTVTDVLIIFGVASVFGSLFFLKEERKKGEKIGMSWAIRKILERYFQSQETMRKVLTREDPALRGDIE